MCDLNTASIAEIGALRGIDALTAHDIGLWAPYRCWDDLYALPCWRPGLVGALRAAGATLSPMRV